MARMWHETRPGYERDTSAVDRKIGSDLQK